MTDQTPQEIWKQFCRDLEEAGDTVFGSDLPAGDIDQAEGLRYLTRLLRISLDMQLEHADPDFPSFYQASHATAKIGSDNPDNFYQNATISSRNTYRISGTRGTVPILSFGTKANRYAVDGTMASTGEIDIRDVKLESGGRFEIIVSQTKQDGNWLPMDEDSSMLIVRQTFFDKSTEIPASVNIETIDGPTHPEPLNLERISTALQSAPAFVGGTAATFRQWAELFHAQNKNALNTVDQTMFFKAGGDPMIHYLHGWWEIEPQQALKIQTSIPECEGWNFQVNNVWMESLDYRHHQIHLNNRSAVLNPDGSVTVYVGGENPGQPNWIETAGHSRGTMLWRWTGAKDHPVPHTEIVTLE